MKVLIILALLTNIVVGNSFDDWEKHLMENFRQEMKERCAFRITCTPEIDINLVSDYTNITGKLIDIYANDVSNFVIDRIENNLIDFYAKYGITFPTAFVKGKFNVLGTFLERRVQGIGNFSANITGLKLAMMVQHELLESRYVHVKQVNITYDIKDMEFNEQGLTIEGLTEDNIQNLIKLIIQNLHDNNEAVSEYISERIKTEVNKRFEGRTLENLVTKLKNSKDLFTFSVVYNKILSFYKKL